MDNYDALRDLVLSLEKDVNEVFNKENKSASIRVRKRLQEVKTLAQNLRVDVIKKIKEW